MSISVERQLELARKYGVSEELITVIQGEDGEERDAAVSEIWTILSTAVINVLVDLEDIDDVSAIVGPRFAISKEDYAGLLALKNIS